MSWPPSSADERRAYEEDGQWLLLHYQCPRCSTEWDDHWSCEVDDDCPRCGTCCTPYDAEDADPPS